MSAAMSNGSMDDMRVKWLAWNWRQEGRVDGSTAPRPGGNLATAK